MEKKRRDYQSFFESQNRAHLEKLIENEYKGDLHISLSEAYRGIDGEKSEVLQELILFEHCVSIKDLDGQLQSLESARREFADVANYAGMGVIECERIIENLKGKLNGQSIRTPKN